MIINGQVISRRQLIALLGASAGVAALPAWAETAEAIAPQPYFASVMRAIAALVDAGQPIAKADADRLATLAANGNAEAVAAAEAILNRYTLARVELDKEGMGPAALGGADRTLIEQGWKVFLIRVSNPARLLEDFGASTGLASPGRMDPFSQLATAQRPKISGPLVNVPAVEKMWLLAQASANSRLSGTAVEYQLVELFSRDRGIREGKIGFGAGENPGRIFGVPFRRAALAKRLAIEFDAIPSRDVALSILDSDGIGCVASILVKDKREHIYPPQVMRIAPDMAFQPHIYRADRETVRLPDGEYSVTSRRGPEYLPVRQSVRISDANTQIAIKLQRWVDPAKWSWYSGDTHIHAAGCAHYMQPTVGVTPETMIRHVRGEALSVGDVLTWGPGWYHQKEFFSGRAVSPEATMEYPDLQVANNAALTPRPTPKDRQSLLRYDVEVSGFPSSLSGHLVLLRLKEQDFPGTKLIEDWPTWNLPILQWAKSQGAVVGFAHCSAGMVVKSTELPNYEIPPFDSIGTNEAIVDVTHDACDFLSGCNGPPAAELNAWYHMLNCGYTLVMVGETDYPCFVPSIDARPGIGRSYVKLDQRPTDDAGYEAWVRALRDGKLYWGDGRTHFLTFAVNGRTSGKQALGLKRVGNVEVVAKVAALLETTPSPETVTNAAEQPWHIEHARISKTRNVLIELIVNGVAVDKMEFLADGTPRDVRFRTKIARSSWVALRVLGSGHTYPVFVTLGDKPIRVSRRSAEWLRKSVDALWNEKHRLMRDSERPAAAEAYDHARRTYDRIIAESEVA